MKILVINFWFLGDLVMMTPVFRTLRNMYPEAQIDLFISHKHTDLFKFNPNIDHVITIDKKDYHKHPFKYFEFIKNIRNEKYDITLCMQPGDKASFYTAISGAKLKSGYYHKKIYSLFYQLITVREDIHHMDGYMEILKSVGVSKFEHNGLEIWTDPEVEQQVETLWQSAGLDFTSKTVAIHPSAGYLQKQWTIEGWIELANCLFQKGYIPVFLGDHNDIPTVNEIVKHLDGKSAVFTGKLTVFQLTAVIKRCQVFVSADSGPLHIAASQKTPIVGLFGPTDPLRFGPREVNNQIVMANLPCIKCGLKKALICEHCNCMKSISAQTVFQAVENLMQG